MTGVNSPAAMAADLGQRLKQARLNANMTQQELADKAGVTVKLVQGTEKGKAQLLTIIAIMQALELEGQLDSFIPVQPISPIQLAKLQGKQRQRASGSRSADQQEMPQW